MTMRSTPSADVFARTVPLVLERHYFGEHRKASLSAVETETDKALLVLSKRLIRMPETQAIRQRDARFREFLNSIAIPFRDGIWLVPVGLVERAVREAEAYEAERDVLADLAATAYPAQIEAMREPLGPLFNPLDYPPVERFRQAFWIEWRFIDFGVPNVLREIRADVFAREREKLEAAGQQAREMIQQHLAGTLLKITDHLGDLLRPRANGRRPALRDGALDAMFEYLDTIALRDVTNFSELQAVTDRLRHVAQGLDVESLRSDDDLRARTADVIDAARTALSGMVSEETRRAIRVRDDEDGDAVA